MVQYNYDMLQAIDDFGQRTVNFALQVFEELEMEEVFYSDYERVDELLKYYDFKVS